MSEEVARIIRRPAITQRLESDMGTFAEASGPPECDAFIQAETAKWARVIQAAGVQID